MTRTDLGQSGLDGGGGVLDEDLEGGSADVRLVEVGRVHPEVLGDTDRVHREEACRGETVDIGDAEPGVGECALGGLRVHTVLGQVGQVRVVGGRDPAITAFGARCEAVLKRLLRL